MEEAATTTTATTAAVNPGPHLRSLLHASRPFTCCPSPQGLYRSVLTCPDCAFHSVKFDPFM